MTKLSYMLNLPAQSDQLMELVMDYQNLPSYLPDQLKSVKIIAQQDDGTVTDEEIFFSSVLKKSIIQQSLHKKTTNNQLLTQIISGPAKGTTVNITFEKNEVGTKISINIDLKLTLKAKFLLPLIKKMYKNILTGIFYKMNNEILSSNKT